jgi:hypothetical protein
LIEFAPSDDPKSAIFVIFLSNAGSITLKIDQTKSYFQLVANMSADYSS